MCTGSRWTITPRGRTRRGMQGFHFLLEQNMPVGPAGINWKCNLGLWADTQGGVEVWCGEQGDAVVWWDSRVNVIALWRSRAASLGPRPPSNLDTSGRSGPSGLQWGGLILSTTPSSLSPPPQPRAMSESVYWSGSGYFFKKCSFSMTTRSDMSVIHHSAGDKWAEICRKRKEKDRRRERIGGWSRQGWCECRLGVPGHA